MHVMPILSLDWHILHYLFTALPPWDCPVLPEFYVQGLFQKTFLIYGQPSLDIHVSRNILLDHMLAGVWSFPMVPFFPNSKSTFNWSLNVLIVSVRAAFVWTKVVMVWWSFVSSIANFSKASPMVLLGVLGVWSPLFGTSPSYVIEAAYTSCPVV